MNNTKIVKVKVDFDKELKAKPTGYSRALNGIIFELVINRIAMPIEI